MFALGHLCHYFITTGSGNKTTSEYRHACAALCVCSTLVCMITRDFWLQEQYYHPGDTQDAVWTKHCHPLCSSPGHHHRLRQGDGKMRPYSLMSVFFSSFLLACFLSSAKSSKMVFHPLRLSLSVYLFYLWELKTQIYFKKFSLN